MSAEEKGEGFGGLFDIDIFGKVISGIENATPQQKQKFIQTVIPIVAACSEADKAAFRNALGVAGPPAGYEPGSVTVMGGQGT